MYVFFVLGFGLFVYLVFTYLLVLVLPPTVSRRKAGSRSLGVPVLRRAPEKILPSSAAQAFEKTPRNVEGRAESRL